MLSVYQLGVVSAHLELMSDPMGKGLPPLQMPMPPLTPDHWL